MRYLFGLICILLSPFVLLGMAFPVLVGMLREEGRGQRAAIKIP